MNTISTSVSHHGMLHAPLLRSRHALSRVETSTALPVRTVHAQGVDCVTHARTRACKESQPAPPSLIMLTSGAMRLSPTRHTFSPQNQGFNVT